MFQCPSLLSCPRFHWHKACQAFAFFSLHAILSATPHHTPAATTQQQNNQNTLIFFHLWKVSQPLKLLVGLEWQRVICLGLDWIHFSPLGCNKGFILNLDTVQHSFWSEVGRGASTSHYENRRVHSAWKAATLGEIRSHVSPCWKAVESQHRTTWQKCHVGRSCFEAVSEEDSFPGWELKHSHYHSLGQNEVSNEHQAKCPHRLF